MDIFVDRVFNLASLWVFPLLALLLADIAVIVLHLVVLVKGVDVVELLGPLAREAELADRVLFLVLGELMPFVHLLLKQKNWLLFEAEQAVVEMVLVIQVLLQGVNRRELPQLLLLFLADLAVES